MSERITTTEQKKNDDYFGLFDSDDKLKQAFEYSMEIRKFEIELFWKRALYFWTLMAASFVAYVKLINDNDSYNVVLTIVAGAGFMLATGWHCVNRGSKYWQINWERHVESLEDSFAGPIYKTTYMLRKSESRFWDGASRYSVSKINILISLYIMLSWFALFVHHLTSMVSKTSITDIGVEECIVATIVVCTIIGALKIIRLNKNEKINSEENKKFQTKEFR